MKAKPPSGVTLRDNAVDPIQPVKITHSVDEVIDNGALQQRYDFLDYEFERDGAIARARVYTDAIGTVSVFGPFADRRTLAAVQAPAFMDDVLAYLKRRFRRVQQGQA